MSIDEINRKAIEIANTTTLSYNEAFEILELADGLGVAIDDAVGLIGRGLQLGLSANRIFSTMQELRESRAGLSAAEFVQLLQPPKRKPRFNRTKAFLVAFTLFFLFAGISHVLGWWDVYEWFGYPNPYNK